MSTRSMRWLTVLLLLATALGASIADVDAQAAKESEPGEAWRFRVYLDDREIGYHHFYLAENGETRQLRSVADFEYHLLFVKVYDYEHENLETWAGNCLQSVQSRTDANGTPYTVTGRRAPEGFRVDATDVEDTLPECVMSFAYWNPTFLQQERLLNTQNGEFLAVDVSEPVRDAVIVRGEQRPAYRYRVEAGELNLELWYSAENEWLALESEVRGGRTLRYELM